MPKIGDVYIINHSCGLKVKIVNIKEEIIELRPTYNGYIWLDSRWHSKFFLNGLTLETKLYKALK